jgi:hypothetical protein
VASALVSMVGSTCQPGKRKEGGTGLEEKITGPWAGFGFGPKRYPAAFLPFPFSFLILFETFAKAPNWFKPISKSVKIFPCQHRHKGKGFDQRISKTNVRSFCANKMMI